MTLLAGHLARAAIATALAAHTEVILTRVFRAEYTDIFGRLTADTASKHKDGRDGACHRLLFRGRSDLVGSGCLRMRPRQRCAS